MKPLPYEKIKSTVKEIWSLPFEERRQAINNVLVKAQSVGLMSDLQRNLQNYLDQTKLKQYSPTYHLEPFQYWNGYYSVWGQYGTDPKTNEKKFAQKHVFYNNEHFDMVRAHIAAANDMAVATNREADDYNQRIAVEFSRIPDKDIDKLINAYNNVTESTNPRAGNQSDRRSVDLSIKSSPEELINTVNMLKSKLMNLGMMSSAPIARMQSDFFKGVLARADRS